VRSPTRTPSDSPATRRSRGLLFVASEAARDEVLNGEERSAANKRERATEIPVGDELAAVLTRWLAVRPDAISDAEPLFVSTSRQ
jgi:site-specific recombinase XerC